MAKAKQASRCSRFIRISTNADLSRLGSSKLRERLRAQLAAKDARFIM